MIELRKGRSAKVNRLFAIFSVVALSACGEPVDKVGTGDPTPPPNNSTPNPTPNSTTPVSTTDCMARCTALGNRCGEPDEDVAIGCGLLCADPLTEAQLSCLEGKSCSELQMSGQDCLAEEDDPAPSNSNSGEVPVNNTPPGNGIGGACNCDPNPEYQLEETRYGYCEGNTNGCHYELFSDDPQLGCIYDYKTGAGTCVYICYEDQEETQGACPDNYTCYNSGRRSITDSDYYTCE